MLSLLLLCIFEQPVLPKIMPPSSPPALTPSLVPGTEYVLVAYKDPVSGRILFKFVPKSSTPSSTVTTMASNDGRIINVTLRRELVTDGGKTFVRHIRIITLNLNGVITPHRVSINAWVKFPNGVKTDFQSLDPGLWAILEKNEVGTVTGIQLVNTPP